MPKLLCGRCRMELVILTSGVWVVEFASFGPYKIWTADEYACPDCGIAIIGGFSNQPLAEHYEPSFPALLRQANESGKVRLDFEHAGQRREWMMTNGGEHANIGTH